MTFLNLAADSSGSINAGSGVGALIVYIIIAISMMGFFKKAGHPSWAAFVPIYNIFVMIEIAGRPGWWLILYIIPIVGIIVHIIVLIDLSKSFGHGVGFMLGLLILSIIFQFILSYGGSRYVGPAGSSGAVTT